VCVSVCVREREKERERGDKDAVEYHIFWYKFEPSIPYISGRMEYDIVEKSTNI